MPATFSHECSRFRRPWPLLLGVALLWLGGCGSYRLQGIVIEGSQPSIEIVDADDPRLERFGLPEAELEVVLDPQRLQPETIARGRSDADGRFSLPIDTSGAGFLILDVEVRAAREDFRSAKQRFDLPGKSRRLVVTLSPGKDRPTPDGGDILQDTLRDASPYLRD